MMRWLGRWTLRVLAGFAALGLAAFAIDWAVYALHRSPQSSVAVNQFMSIPLKGQKTEYDYLETSNVPCDVALFPHSGEVPCWYLKRNVNQWENVGTPAY